MKEIILWYKSSGQYFMAHSILFASNLSKATELHFSFIVVPGCSTMPASSWSDGARAPVRQSCWSVKTSSTACDYTPVTMFLLSSLTLTKDHTFHSSFWHPSFRHTILQCQSLSTSSPFFPSFAVSCVVWPRHILQAGKVFIQFWPSTVWWSGVTWSYLRSNLGSKYVSVWCDKWRIISYCS